MSMMKYRVHEVAKDFNTTSKVITQILTDYATTPKNHMQVLENDELDVIFEYMTQHNQVASIEDIFNVPAPKAAEPKKPSLSLTKKYSLCINPHCLAISHSQQNGSHKAPSC